MSCALALRSTSTLLRSKVLVATAGLSIGYRLSQCWPHMLPSSWDGIGPDGRHHRGAVVLAQLVARVGVQRIVQRLDLLPQAFHLGGEGVRRHVVLRAPHRAGVGKAHFARALVGDGDVLGVVLLVRRRLRVPAEPDFFQAGRVAAFGQHFFHVAQRHAGAGGAVRLLRTVLGFAVGAGHAGGQARVRFAVAGVGQHQGQLQQLELAGGRFRQLEAVEAARLAGHLAADGEELFVRLGGDRLGVASDEIFRYPFGALGVDAHLFEPGFGIEHEAFGFGDGRLGVVRRRGRRPVRPARRRRPGRPARCVAASWRTFAR